MCGEDLDVADGEKYKKILQADEAKSEAKKEYEKGLL